MLYRKQIKLYRTIACVSIILTSLPILAPFAAETPAGHLIYKIFSLFCHQEDNLSPHIAGTKTAVCSRCLGIYAGFTLTSISYYLYIKYARKVKTSHRVKTILFYNLTAWFLTALDALISAGSGGTFVHIRRLSIGIIAGNAAFFLLIILTDYLVKMKYDQEKP